MGSPIWAGNGIAATAAFQVITANHGQIKTFIGDDYSGIRHRRLE